MVGADNVPDRLGKGRTASTRAARRPHARARRAVGRDKGRAGSRRGASGGGDTSARAAREFARLRPRRAAGAAAGLALQCAANYPDGLAPTEQVRPGTAARARLDAMGWLEWRNKPQALSDTLLAIGERTAARA